MLRGRLKPLLEEYIGLKSTIEIDSFLEVSPARFAAASHRTPSL